jgi:hypothetical protein
VSDDGAARRERYGHLPDPVRPDDYAVDVPVFQDDRPAPVHPPAGAPELVAATQIADGTVRPQSIRRPARRAGLIVMAIGLGIAFVPVLLVALFS